MVRSVFGKVMWVGRVTVFLVGLAVILALVFGVASLALAGMGRGAPFNLGQTNTVDKVSTLVNNGAGPALNLRVGPSNATPANNTVMPMRVNSQTKVTNLNADELEGRNASVLEKPRGYAHIAIGGDVDTNYPSKGVVDVLIPAGKTAVYCFDLTFTPTAAVGSPHFNNSAVVAAATPDNGPADDPVTQNCPPTHRDAAVHTFGSDTGSAAAINFQVVFF